MAAGIERPKTPITPWPRVRNRNPKNPKIPKKSVPISNPELTRQWAAKNWSWSNFLSRPDWRERGIRSHFKAIGPPTLDPWRPLPKLHLAVCLFVCLGLNVFESVFCFLIQNGIYIKKYKNGRDSPLGQIMSYLEAFEVGTGTLMGSGVIFLCECQCVNHVIL